MKTELECMPCFFRQIRLALGYAGVNGDAGRSIMRAGAEIVEQASFDQPPARITTVLHRMVRERTGSDPYRRVKDRYNAIALEKLPSLRRTAAKAADPLEAGVRLAIAGNVIDFGIYEAFDLDRSIEDSFRLQLSESDFSDFSKAVQRSRRILYLCDNAGEIVFDRVLAETLREDGKIITAAVKGAAVINDATLEDAAAAGLAESAEVIDNGNDGIGTLLESCSPRFMDAYRSADMVISKGQANYETLAGTGDNRIFFMFKVKCPVVARELGRENGDIVLMRSVQR